MYRNTGVSMLSLNSVKPIKSIILSPAFLGVFSIFLLTWLIYLNTWESLVDIWVRSETFAHGFIVIPISLWIIWQKKEIHPYLYPTKPSWAGLSFLLLNGLLWLLASLIHALVIQQYALVGIIIGGIWFYLGNEATKKIIFPLAFLYFMVPVGEALLPYLMQYTADFTVFLLRKTGLTVYREGMHFELVTGKWSVVEACSGLRYLLASFTLGTIYAYINYTKTYKRIIFSLFSLILPIIANGFRAYMIVMIGHLSNMKLAVGVDHILYGAVFFAFIIFFMFYVGSFWKDKIESKTPRTKTTSLTPNIYYSKKKIAHNLLIVTLTLSIFNISSQWLKSHYKADKNIAHWIPVTSGSHWNKINIQNWNWYPKFSGSVTDALTFYNNGKETIGVYQANFGNEKQGSELISSSNTLLYTNMKNKINYRKMWHILDEYTITNNIANNNLPSSMHISILKHNYLDDSIAVLKWYQLGNNTTTNKYKAKLMQLLKRLTLNNKPELYNIVFFRIEDKRNNKKEGSYTSLINRK